MKKVIYFLMAGILACQFMITDVFAISALIDLDDVVEKGNEYMSDLVSMENDASNKQFLVNVSSTDKVNYKYADEYLEYSNDKAPTTEDEVAKIWPDISIVYILVAGAYGSLGCTDEQISNIFSWFDEVSKTFNANNYDKYGIIFESAECSTTACDSDYIDRYVKHFKFSFDKNRMKNVINDYSNREYSDDSVLDDENNNAIPVLSFGTTSADYITIAAEVLDISDSDDTLNCNIYRSEEKDGEYKLIGAVACDGSNYLYDKDVVKEKKYFYKASVVGNDKLSDAYSAIAVTAKSTPSDNPDTGISIAYVLGALILVLTFATAIVFDRDKIEVK